jgi:hypothetical protein
MQIRRAYVRVVLGLWRACARIAIRPVSVVDIRTLCLPGDAYAEIGYTLVPDNDVRCFGYAEVHRINVVWSAGRVAFVPRRTYDPPSPLLITYSTV